MASLREIKDRIGSVKSTLKITSAMKLVASSKLRKAQKAIENLRPYEAALNEILSSLRHPGFQKPEDSERKGKTALVAISSNSSLCGGFNANVIKKAQEVANASPDTVVFCVGRKMSEAMRKAGFSTEGEWSDLIGKPAYDKSAALAGTLVKKFFDGEFGKVILVYNHFVSTSRQLAVAEEYLPFPVSDAEGDSEAGLPDEYIVEPSPKEVAETLLPQVLMMKFHAAVLDSAAAEHAARTVAMQTASDNAEELLGDLTLEYNKGRQQKITAEILDLLGGNV